MGGGMVKARQRFRRRGFVLLDILTALAVLSTGVFVAMVFFRAHVRELRYMQERFAAILLAESEIEYLRALPYEDIRVGESRPVSLRLQSAGQLREATGRLAVQEIKPGLKTAEVRIRWVSPKGRSVGVEMASKFSKEACASERTTARAHR